jgi:tRNA modification GTPase
MNNTDTIAAIATPSGRGGIGIVRISGDQVPHLAEILLGKLPQPRVATFAHFRNQPGEVLDHGIALYFPAPHSFTGEHLLELQGHGGIVILDMLLQAVLQLGVRLARPGEFSERAFLNGKIDLTQAEAIADLIDSSSEQAARSALRSLQGEFSIKIRLLVDELIWLRTYIEAGIDFPEEEIDLWTDGQIAAKITQLIQSIAHIFEQAQQGFLLKEGVRIALIGEPNVGKSSLLNQLAGRETAIVTPIAGTTRDIVRDTIQLEGVPVHIVDTAGLRETLDVIEQEGIRRTQLAVKEADLVLIILDERHPSDSIEGEWLSELPRHHVIVRNKIDIIGQPAGLKNTDIVYLSAKTGAGISDLKQLLKQKIGMQPTAEGTFLARRRHLDALQRAQTSLSHCENLMQTRQTELLAEELRQAQQALNEITGEFSTEDLLGQIFATFCLGK